MPKVISPSRLPEGVRLPKWLRREPGSAAEAHLLKQLLRRSKLNTVCEEARCPNIAECFSRSTATFMILGDICTRGCRFCAIKTGRPELAPSEFKQESLRVAEAADALGLKHVVVTSVTRDDLSDGGAGGFALTIAALRERLKSSTIEVLVPDFRHAPGALETVTAAGPDVFNHNLETVPRLYSQVRPGANYSHSLKLLSRAKELNPGMIVKTGIMLGFGETKSEVLELMRDAKAAGVDFFTAGQYLQPTAKHLPVAEYVTEEMFAEYAEDAASVGFKYAAVGPLVRSSYHADEAIERAAQSV